MKTRIFETTGGVTVERDDPISGERTTTTYFVPSSGGYVRIRDRDGRYPQVCNGLSSTGPTLHCRNPENLPALIRREYRKLAAANKRHGV